MDFYNVPIGFGLALSANTAAMNRYAHLPEEKKQEMLNKAQRPLGKGNVHPRRLPRP